MRRLVTGAVVALATCSAPAANAAGPSIHTEDVARFYEVYDAAGGHPNVDQNRSARDPRQERLVSGDGAQIEKAPEISRPQGLSV
jgi:hypothetical protein